MEFEKKDNVENAGKVIGFVLMYIIFTGILYFVLKVLGKFPNNWNFLYIINITLFIVLIGNLIKIFLSR